MFNIQAGKKLIWLFLGGVDVGGDVINLVITRLLNQLNWGLAELGISALSIYNACGTCCKLHLLQIACVPNCTFCTVHVLHSACVAKCMCC